MANTIDTSERKNAVDGAINCFGIAFVLRERVRRLKWKLDTLKFSGLLGVVLVGLVVVTKPESEIARNAALWFAGVINALNFIFVLISMNWKWEDSYHAYIESISENEWLAGRYNELYRDTAMTNAKWKQNYGECRLLSVRREEKDVNFNIAETERHMGYRAGLIQYQQSCGGPCGVIPTDMNPTNCVSCGQFKVRKGIFKWL